MALMFTINGVLNLNSQHLREKVKKQYEVLRIVWFMQKLLYIESWIS